jgi:hypothetical protein
MAKNKNIYLIYLILFMIFAFILEFLFKNKNALKNTVTPTGVENFQDITMLEPPISNGYFFDRFQTRSDNALDRVINPLRYPYKYPTFYNEMYYPPQISTLPSQVVGCGGRRGACMGGTQIPITHTMPSLDISNTNIAPINIRTRGPLEEAQQVGVMYKTFGNDNQVYPLYGRRTYTGSDKWEYYTQMGRMNVKIPIETRNNNNNELGDNDEVSLRGKGETFRVTIYENDSPMYVPYL